MSARPKTLKSKKLYGSRCFKYRYKDGLFDIEYNGYWLPASIKDFEFINTALCNLL